MCLESVREAGECAYLLLGEAHLLLAEGYTLDEECHIATQVAHGLEAFEVFLHIFLRVAMHFVPIGARDNGHAGYGKVFVYLVKC